MSTERARTEAELRKFLREYEFVIQEYECIRSSHGSIDSYFDDIHPKHSPERRQQIRSTAEHFYDLCECAGLEVYALKRGDVEGELRLRRRTRAA